MSAYLVSHYTIGAMVKYYLQGREKPYWQSHQASDADAPAMMALLADENARSVNARYVGHPAQAAVTFNERLSFYADLSEVQVLKACACYTYQACETDDWERTEARELVTAIEHKAIRRLPGYEDAEWGIDYGYADTRAHYVAHQAKLAEAREAQEMYRRAYAD